MSQSTNKIIAGIIQYLKSTGKLNLLPAIAHELTLKSRHMESESRAIITSAYRLNDLESRQISQALNTIFGRKLSIVNRVDRSIIGGLKISVSDKVIDLSIDKTLNDLKSDISHD